MLEAQTKKSFIETFCSEMLFFMITANVIEKLSFLFAFCLLRVTEGYKLCLNNGGKVHYWDCLLKLEEFLALKQK